MSENFQRKENSEKKLSETFFELRMRMQNEGEGEMHFRYFKFRSFFFAENTIRYYVFCLTDTDSSLSTYRLEDRTTTD